MDAFECTPPQNPMNIFVVYIFMYMQIHMKVCTHVHVGMCTWSFKDNLGCSSQAINLFPPFFETGSLICLELTK